MHERLERSAWLLTPSSDVRVPVVDGEEDIERLIRLYPRRITGDERTWLDWEAVARDYDGLRVTERGVSANREREDSPLGPWDVESTLWFRWVFKDVASAAPRER